MPRMPPLLLPRLPLTCRLPELEAVGNAGVLLIVLQQT